MGLADHLPFHMEGRGRFLNPRRQFGERLAPPIAPSAANTLQKQQELVPGKAGAQEIHDVLTRELSAMPEPPFGPFMDV